MTRLSPLSVSCVLSFKYSIEGSIADSGSRKTADKMSIIMTKSGMTKPIIHDMIARPVLNRIRFHEILSEIFQYS